MGEEGEGVKGRMVGVRVVDFGEGGQGKEGWLRVKGLVRREELRVAGLGREFRGRRLREGIKKGLIRREGKGG